MYTIAQGFPGVNPEIVFAIGLVFSIFVGIGIVLFGLKLGSSTESKLLVATMSVLLLPFVLPRMHDRYFFLADIFTFLLAFKIRGTWPIALLVQLGSLFAYTQFLFGYSLGPTIGAGFMTLAVVGVLGVAARYWNEPHLRLAEY